MKLEKNKSKILDEQFFQLKTIFSWGKKGHTKQIHKAL